MMSLENGGGVRIDAAKEHDLSGVKESKIVQRDTRGTSYWDDLRET